MKFTKCFVVFGLCLLMGSCVFEEGESKGELEIDIGDYENQLEAWNSQGMLDYQLDITCREYIVSVDGALINVKNGIPDSEPFGKRYSTVPEIYSIIKIAEESVRNEYNSGDNRSRSYIVRYDTKHHYPSSITSKTDYRGSQFIFRLMPLEDGELEIDIGDYENQLEAWNNQNMLDYQIKVSYYWGDYCYSFPGATAIYNVKNGIPDPSFSLSSGKERTIPEIYSLIKRLEGGIKYEYNGINHSYLNVQYNTEYHYPVQISAGVGHNFGTYWRWRITLTPPEETE